MCGLDVKGWRQKIYMQNTKDDNPHGKITLTLISDVYVGGCESEGKPVYRKVY